MKTMFPREFIDYLLMVITQEFFPQESDGGDTEYFDYYGRIKDKNDLVTLDDLYKYWRLEIEPKTKEDESEM